MHLEYTHRRSESAPRSPHALDARRRTRVRERRLRCVGAGVRG